MPQNQKAPTPDALDGAYRLRDNNPDTRRVKEPGGFKEDN